MDFDPTFRTVKEAEDFGSAYIADEDPGTYFKVAPASLGRFRVDFYEADGYHINQEAPRLSVGGTVVAPRPQSHPHLG